MAFARMNCWQDTVARAALLDPPPPAEKRRYDPASQPHPSIECQHDPASQPHRRGVTGGEPPVVEETDCLECALRLRESGLNPAVLSLADPHMPGGSVPLGTAAQEESIFRRTNLHLSLSNTMYPLKPDEVVYSPGITVFKDAAGVPFDRPLERCLAVITCPGLREPDCRVDLRTGERRLRPPDVTRLRAKIRAVLQAASAHGHDSIVLGALGCGRGRCPPWHVAQVFHEVLAELGGAFRHVAFAIMDAGVAEAFRKKINPPDATPTGVNAGLQP